MLQGRRLASVVPPIEAQIPFCKFFSTDFLKVKNRSPQGLALTPF
jgi:hypothetical protein